MKIDFYEKEVKRLQARFNQAFGSQPVCNWGEKQAVIMAICWLGVINQRIKKRPDSKELVKEFIKGRNILNKYFNHKERSSVYVEYPIKREAGGNTQAIRDRIHTITG